jgi:hypothetical protein
MAEMNHPLLRRQARRRAQRLAPRQGVDCRGRRLGAVTGVLPHVLHHIGPLAGAALLAGAGGKLLFAVAGFVLSGDMTFAEEKNDELLAAGRRFTRARRGFGAERPRLPKGG